MHTLSAGDCKRRCSESVLRNAELNIFVELDVWICSSMCPIIAPALFQRDEKGELFVLRQGPLTSVDAQAAHATTACSPLEAIA